MKRLARHRVIFCVLLIAVFFDLAYQLGLPIVFRYLFDDGIVRERFDILFGALGILCMLLIGYGLSMIVQEWAGSALVVRGGNRLRQHLFTRLQALPPLATAEQAQGALVTLFATDVAAIEMALVRGVPVSLIGILLIACSLGLLLAISWQLFLITLGTVAANAARMAGLAARGASFGASISRQQGDTATVAATAHDGDLFGELALVRDQPCAATVTARAESWCLPLSRQHFLRIIKTEAGLGGRIAAAIAGSVASAT